MKLIKKFNRYISVLFVMTIVITALTSYYTFNQIVHSHVRLQQQATVPLYGLITNEIIRPLTVASFMARDKFLIDIADSNTVNVDNVYDYLEHLTRHYNMVSFVAFEKHNFTIDSNKKILNLDEKQAEWYPRIKALPSDQYIDFGNEENPHLYFDIKIFNNNKDFLGLTGVGIDLDYFAKTFSDFQERFGIELVFVDKEGTITLTSNYLMKTERHHRKEEKINIHDLQWYKTYTEQKTHTNDAILPDLNLIVSALPIPEIDWQVYIIMPPASNQSEYWKIFIQKLLIIFSVAILLVLIFNLTLKAFRKDLAKDSETDFLTHLPTRGFVHWHFEQLQEKHQNISLIIADIDNFKHINDQYGHLTGDNVLKAIASHINVNMRSIDIVGRWGGEEFIMLLPDIDADKAREVIERLRCSIEDIQVPVEGANKSVKVTVSFGITDGNIQEESLKELIARADKALYKAKSAGRNRTIIYR